MAIRLRFAPPRTAPSVPLTDVQKGDWVFVSGYWWTVTSVRDNGGMKLCDVESPRGRHYSVWTHHLEGARRGL